jgi:hypothetical protein
MVTQLFGQVPKERVETLPFGQAALVDRGQLSECKKSGWH